MANKTEEKKELFGFSRRMIVLLAAFSLTIAFGTAFLVFYLTWESGNEHTRINSHLIEFYGRECPHCARMAPVVKEVEAEIGFEFSKLEVWHSSENERIYFGYSEAIKTACGGELGVPAFYNTRTEKALCGEVDKGTLLAWAKEN